MAAKKHTNAETQWKARLKMGMISNIYPDIAIDCAVSEVLKFDSGHVVQRIFLGRYVPRYRHDFSYALTS